MKIVDNMGLLRGSNQYKKKVKKSFRLKRLVIILVIIGVAFIGYKAHFQSIEPWQVDQPIQQDDGLTQEQRESLAKQAELAKQETVLMNKKTKLDNDYKTASQNIETQLEAIRSQKLSFK